MNSYQILLCHVQIQPSIFIRAINEDADRLINGKELSRRIRNHSPRTKIAVMTGGEIDVAMELLKDGTANYFFSKPFDLNSICKSLVGQYQTT